MAHPLSSSIKENGISQGKPCAKEQLKRVTEILSKETTLKLDEKYYLIPTKWYQSWKAYIGWQESYENVQPETDEEIQEEEPGDIDTSELLDDTINNIKNYKNEYLLKIKPSLQEGNDYNLVSKQLWETLTKWYGSHTIPIYRLVIAEGASEVLRVEVYPLIIKVIIEEVEKEKPVSIKTTETEVLISKKFSLQLLKVEVLTRLNFSSSYDELIRVWNCYNKPERLMEDVKKSLEDYDIISGQVITFEKKTSKKSKWPRDLSNGIQKSGWFSGGIMNSLRNLTSYIMDNVDVETDTENEILTRKYPIGVIGLANLGNTCFMNSAIQCLSNTPQLREHFLNDAFKAEINKSNPLGLSGQLAEQFGALIKVLWSSDDPPKFRSVSPKGLKRIVAKFAPQFSGYSQHDAQELLAFVLDGLHEDLNKIKNKPYLTAVESDGSKSDCEIAKLSWEIHKKRNDSKIIDLFQGQLKSKLVCPTCNKISITFDPFMYLSLPMPFTNDISIEVFVVNVNHQRLFDTKKFIVSGIKKSDKLFLVKTKLNEMMNSKLKKENQKKRRFLMGEVCKRDHMITGLVSETRIVGAVDYVGERRAIFAFEIPEQINLKEVMKLQLCQRKINAKWEALSAEEKKSPKFKSVKKWEVVGLPHLAYISISKTTGRQLYLFIYQKLKNYFFRKNAKLSKSGRTEQETDPKSASPEAPDNGKETNGPSTSDEVAKSEQQTDDAPSASSEVADTEQPTKDDEPSASAEVTDDQTEVIEEEAVWPNPELLDLLSKNFDENEIFFDLISVNSAGTGCGKCAFGNGCGGCKIEFSDDPISWKELTSKITSVAIHFNDSSKLPGWWDKTIWKAIETDESVELWEKSKKEKENNRTLRVEDCFDLFCQSEILGENDMWYCPGCKEHKQASKQIEIWKLPDILVIHLKRFLYNHYTRDKINGFCDFPITKLEVGDYVANENEKHAIYDLYAVSNHSGGLRGGHYTAYAKNYLDGKWYNFNDSQCSRISEENVKSSAAYVLFYKRRTSKEEKSKETD